MKSGRRLTVAGGASAYNSSSCYSIMATMRFLCASFVYTYTSIDSISYLFPTLRATFTAPNPFMLLVLLVALL